MSTGKTKIALVGDSLGGGGAEKVQALLSIFLKVKALTYTTLFLLMTPPMIMPESCTILASKKPNQPLKNYSV